MRLLLACCASLIVWACDSSPPKTFPQTGLTLKIKNEISRHEIFSAFLLPNEETELEVLHAEAECTARAEEGSLRAISRNKWRYRAPATSGDYVVQINASKKSVRFNVFVMVPFAEIKDEYLHGYRIGAYPEKPLRGQKIYEAPTGFIKVTASNQNIFLTPHFQLKQFLCKQEGAFPKFVVLHERLLLALEFILQRVQAEGYKINTFGFISGYRTPYYNATIENTPNSRHVYGDAADIFIDANLDGKMDDLNRDGRINERDVQVMYDLIDALSEDAGFQPFLGGLGFYKRTSAHEGFVHVDTRGVKVEW